MVKSLPYANLVDQVIVPGKRGDILLKRGVKTPWRLSRGVVATFSKGDGSLFAGAIIPSML
jgi:hypothetical protein